MTAEIEIVSNTPTDSFITTALQARASEIRSARNARATRVSNAIGKLICILPESVIVELNLRAGADKSVTVNESDRETIFYVPTTFSVEGASLKLLFWFRALGDGSEPDISVRANENDNWRTGDWTLRTRPWSGAGEDDIRTHNAQLAARKAVEIVEANVATRNEAFNVATARLKKITHGSPEWNYSEPAAVLGALDEKLKSSIPLSDAQKQTLAEHSVAAQVMLQQHTAARRAKEEQQKREAEAREAQHQAERAAEFERVKPAARKILDDAKAHVAALEAWAANESARLWSPWTSYTVRYVPCAMNFAGEKQTIEIRYVCGVDDDGDDLADQPSLESLIQTAELLEPPDGHPLRAMEAVRRDGSRYRIALGAVLDYTVNEHTATTFGSHLDYHRFRWAGEFCLSYWVNAPPDAGEIADPPQYVKPSWRDVLAGLGAKEKWDLRDFAAEGDELEQRIAGEFNSYRDGQWNW